VILLDGTMSTLDPGRETNIGRIYKLLRAMPPSARISVYYEAGVQWRTWRDTRDVAVGRGINRQIRRTYGWLASHYRPGDRIFLFGFSRGAYAVRSLAGIIDRVGLLRADSATERNVMLAYRYYQSVERRAGEAAFHERFCHPKVEVEMIGVFDTVKALGVRLPLVWRWSEKEHRFHNHHLSPVVRHGFHALARDETRAVFRPVLWDTGSSPATRVEQVWFRGTHGDVGGHLNGYEPARPLANIPLVWMLDRAESVGLPLPEGWRGAFPTDPAARSVGTWRGIGPMFLIRGRRRTGVDPSERHHPTVAEVQVRRLLFAQLIPFRRIGRR
jgi:uncharacterized protein (DUF2235 family)